jgi:MarR family transcriptional regulator, organic hydroperoxide resistance regulator
MNNGEPMAAARRTRSGIEPMSGGRKDSILNKPNVGNQDLIKRVGWEIASISVYLDELRRFWAKALGISGPQWMILMALSDLDKDDGVPVNVVSKMLHVDPSFVTTQSKLLEKKGLLRRKPSPTDARVVRMSLTDKTYKHLANLTAQQEAVDTFIFEEFAAGELADFTAKLTALKNRLEKARLKIALDL